MECAITAVSGFKSSATEQEQTGASECIDGDLRVPMGTSDGSNLFVDVNGSILTSGTPLYVTFDGTNCGRGWSSSWYRTKNDPDFFDPYTEAITGSFGCTTCNGSQTGIATQFFWEDDNVAICTFTGTGCGGNPDTNVCDAPDDDCAATDQICEKVSITSFAADNNHATRTFEFDQVAGFKPHWYDSKTGLVPCTVVYTDSGTPANSYTRLGYALVDGIDNSYSNTVRLWSGSTFIDQDNVTGGEFTESGEPCSGTHGGTEACETPLLGSLGDMTWSYSQVSNECADEPTQNCCATSGCGYTGMTAFTITDTDQFGSNNYQWVMQSYIKTSSCSFTMSMNDTSGNGGGTTTWYLNVQTFPSSGAGLFTLEPAFGDTYNNSSIAVTFTNCDLSQSVNGIAGFSTQCPITATFTDSGSC